MHVRSGMVTAVMVMLSPGFEVFALWSRTMSIPRRVDAMAPGFIGASAASLKPSPGDFSFIQLSNGAAAYSKAAVGQHAKRTWCPQTASDPPRLGEQRAASLSCLFGERSRNH
ncbi:hypothetical protein BU24DRAFT_466027 [Aaosphaeria arxii CBS 175.79]|uniref:Uncharacterized protein n=1 Tax=Aaosphaeria arxii CBS 175.79 TaxID=1450172 RepID=A0A6A5XEG9_9PLEO|nr:uncharacterized protein BU24DRAFT_466027 [Aaosphaeria arxii CBS 175.79]KAF2011300.1 hypothetical protein BU24DRAFT_466027 [Aaosphaeria arxii CBS 175.79]